MPATPRAPSRIPAAEPPLERTGPYVLAAALFVLWIAFGWLSKGTMNDDDLSRYFLVRRAFFHPELLIHMWGRPLFMILYVLPARLGYHAVEFVTAAVSALTLLVTARLAKAAGVRAVFAAAAFTAFQPFVFNLGYSALTEPLAALCLALSLWLSLTGRFALGAFLAGLVPLARLETAPVVPLLLIPAIQAKRWRVLPLAVLPLVLWSLGGTLAEGDPLWLPNALFHGRMTRSLKPLSLPNYFRSFPLITGGVILPLFLAGAVRRRALDEREGARDILRWVFLLQFIVLVLLGWNKIHFGASIGYMRHFVAIGPVIGILAAHGLERWERRDLPASERKLVVACATAGLLAALAMSVIHIQRYIFEHPSNPRAEPWIWSLGGAAAFAWLWMSGLAPRLRGPGLVLLAAAAVLVAEPPMGLSPERQCVARVLRVARSPQYAGRVVAVNHPWFPFLDHHDADDRSHYVRMTQANLDSLPPGSLVAWDSHFSNRLGGDVPFEYFKTRRQYVLITREMIRRPAPFLMMLFEKTEPGRAGP